MESVVYILFQCNQLLRLISRDELTRLKQNTRNQSIKNGDNWTMLIFAKKKSQLRLLTGHCIPAIDRYNLPLARRDQIPVKILHQKKAHKCQRIWRFICKKVRRNKAYMRLRKSAKTKQKANNIQLLSCHKLAGLFTKVIWINAKDLQINRHPTKISKRYKRIIEK